MVASPRALGMIRAHYSELVRRALRGEVGKDLVKLPVYEIEKQLLRSGAARQRLLAPPETRNPLGDA